MVTEEQKFRSRIIELGGIALLAPMGKILLYPFQTFSEYGATMFLISFGYSLLLAYFGLNFIFQSYDIINTERRDL
ncbi:MAG: hypothetical protein HY094_04895 [Candidatus Melainabacteria bacterium]|nr:hypothetical protein [Candidatus Melainabacteria bacterium]